MPAKLYGYAEKSVDVDALQAYAGVDVILEDMPDRGQYKMLRRFLREGDTLMVTALSSLGDSDGPIGEELDYFLQHEIRLVVLELPITLQELDTSSTALVYRTVKEVLRVWQHHKEAVQVQRLVRQKEGIQAAREAGRQFGRPTIDYPKDWKCVFEQWQARDISAVEACRKLKLSRSTFFRMAKRYRQNVMGGGD